MTSSSKETSVSVSGTKEVFLEKKLMMLEKRLTLVEKFLETRFCSGADLQKHLTTLPKDVELNLDRDSRAKTDEPSSLRKRNSKRSVTSTLSPPPVITKRIRIHVTRADAVTASSKLSASPKTTIPSTRTMQTRSSKNNVWKTITQSEDEEDNGPDQEKGADSIIFDESEAKPAGFSIADFGDSQDGDETEYFSFPTSESEKKFDVDHIARNEGDNNNDDNDWEHDLSEVDPPSDDPLDSESELETGKPKKKRESPIKIAGIGPGRPIKSKKGRTKKLPSEWKWRSTLTPLTALPSAAKLITTDTTLTECPTCHKHFKKEKIEEHLLSHTKERTVKCPSCDKTFISYHGLQKHARLHNLDKYAKQCRLCNRVSHRSDKLLDHERNCIKRALLNGEPVDPAVMEDVRNRSTKSLNWPDDNNSEEKVKCETCHKIIFKNKLERHLKSHVELPRPWKCNLCDKTYTNKRSLVRHMCIVHAEEDVSGNILKGIDQSNDDKEVEDEVPTSSSIAPIGPTLGGTEGSEDVSAFLL